MIQRGSPVGLPGYAWDPRLHNYIDMKSRRMVGRQAINDLLRSVADGSGARLEKLAQAANEWLLTPRQFYELAQREIKHSFNACAALAKGGWDRMTPADWGMNGWQLRQQYAHLRQFAADIAAKLPSLPQAMARARSYADAAFGRFWELKRGIERLRGRSEERIRTAGDDRVCDVCEGLEKQGWQPIGTLPLAGRVHVACRCDMEYR